MSGELNPSVLAPRRTAGHLSQFCRFSDKRISVSDGVVLSFYPPTVSRIFPFPPTITLQRVRFAMKHVCKVLFFYVLPGNRVVMAVVIQLHCMFPSSLRHCPDDERFVIIF